MNLKFRLALMNFLEFAVWGAYLTCMGNYLGVAGLGDKISWFYAIQGIVSIFMPTLMGIVADKYIQPQRLLGLCHLAAGAFMLGCWWLGLQAGFGQELPNKSLFIALYTISVAFFMPTIALANTAAFTILKNNGGDTVKDFPPIRVLGTVGFIITMWFVNCAVWQDGSFSMTLADNDYKFQYTYMQFFVSGILSVVLCFYCFTLPECKIGDLYILNNDRSKLALLQIGVIILFPVIFPFLDHVGHASAPFFFFCHIHLPNGRSVGFLTKYDYTQIIVYVQSFLQNLVESLKKEKRDFEDLKPQLHP